MAVSIPNLTASRALHMDVEIYVLELLRSGEVRPGDRLSEAELARRLGISRTPVREAMARLLRDGVLQHSPRRGVFVPQHEPAQIEEVASLRAVLEGFAARRACSRIAPAELEQLRTVIEAGAEAARYGDWLSMEEKNAEFHDMLVRFAQHQLLLRSWRLLSPAAWKLIAATPSTPPSAETVADFLERHHRVIEALASGDPQRAEREATAHVQRAGGR
ncbi:MAG TPA: GntR family transcriptional regulator, partial [Chloroflexota bacterium]